MKQSSARAINVLWKGADLLAGALTNTLLFSFYLYGASFGKQGSLGVHRAFDEAEEALRDFDYTSIKNALNHLAKTGLIKRSRKRSQQEITITTEGKRRIEELFPMYRSSRPWDGHVYLISYDIPTKSNKARNLLRTYIRRTGGALLQESLWINPYNPTSIIEEFIENRGIPGTVLVSKLGTDGTIGEEKLTDLIARVYPYSSLSQRYNEFVSTYTGRNHPSPIAAAVAYFAILRDDPQLPFPLEPKGFPGAHAYELFENLRRGYTHNNK